MSPEKKPKSNNAALERKLYAIKSLKSEECHCGAEKEPGRAFCYKCYKSLPKHMQSNLWKKVGQGYEEAYEAACLYLDQEA